MMMTTVMMVGAILNICLSRSSYLVSLAPPNSPIAPAYHHSSITSLSNCNCIFACVFVFRSCIGHESDCCLALSLTDLLTNSCLVDLIDTTQADEATYSKVVDVSFNVEVSLVKSIGDS